MSIFEGLIITSYVETEIHAYEVARNGYSIARNSSWNVKSTIALHKLFINFEAHALVIGCRQTWFFI